MHVTKAINLTCQEGKQDEEDQLNDETSQQPAGASRQLYDVTRDWIQTCLCLAYILLPSLAPLNPFLALVAMPAPAPYSSQHTWKVVTGSWQEASDNLLVRGLTKYHRQRRCQPHALASAT